MGLADTGNFYGLVRFLRAAEREGVKAVAGAELGGEPPPGGEARGVPPTVTAYVLDRPGFARLGAILTGLKAGRPLAGLLEEGWEGLALLADDPPLLRRLAGRAGGRGGLHVRLVYGLPIRARVRLARELGLPLCAVNDAWAADRAGLELGDLLRAMARNCAWRPFPRPSASPPAAADRHRLADDGEMRRFFSAVPEALENARRLAEKRPPARGS